MREREREREIGAREKEREKIKREIEIKKDREWGQPKTVDFKLHTYIHKFMYKFPHSQGQEWHNKRRELGSISPDGFGDTVR